jgi:hypothetical protein
MIKENKIINDKSNIKMERERRSKHLKIQQYSEALKSALVWGLSCSQSIHHLPKGVFFNRREKKKVQRVGLQQPK